MTALTLGSVAHSSVIPLINLSLPARAEWLIFREKQIMILIHNTTVCLSLQKMEAQIAAYRCLSH